MPKGPKQTATTLTRTVSKPYEIPQNGSLKKKGSEQSFLSLEEMRDLGDLNREEYGKSKCTRKQYNRYIKSGGEFLATCIKQRRASNAASQDGHDNDLLEKAFDKPPNKLSTVAIEWFLAQKCFKEECGESTAMAIYSAFAWHWDNM
jgi:hypothetical protein